MIARIYGKIIDKGKNHIIIDTGGICYQVLLPATVIQRITEGEFSQDEKVNLITYHYFQVEPSRNIPILIGFLNEVEKEFFEAFITVSGIGPRAALRALNQPISLIARAIDEGNTKFLKSLPGIGEQKAKEIIVKLQSKIGKFGLIQDNNILIEGEKIRDIEEEVLAVLTQLEYKRSEAVVMIKKALERSAGIKTAEELLNEVYKQRKVN